MYNRKELEAHLSRKRTLELRQWCTTNRKCSVRLDKGRKVIVVKQTVVKRDPILYRLPFYTNFIDFLLTEILYILFVVRAETFSLRMYVQVRSFFCGQISSLKIVHIQSRFKPYIRWYWNTFPATQPVARTDSILGSVTRNYPT